MKSGFTDYQWANHRLAHTQCWFHQGTIRERLCLTSHEFLRIKPIISEDVWQRIPVFGFDTDCRSIFSPPLHLNCNKWSYSHGLVCIPGVHCFHMKCHTKNANVGEKPHTGNPWWGMNRPDQMQLANLNTVTDWQHSAWSWNANQFTRYIWLHFPDKLCPL